VERCSVVKADLPLGFWKTQDQGAATILVAAFDPALTGAYHDNDIFSCGMFVENVFWLISNAYSFIRPLFERLSNSKTSRPRVQPQGCGETLAAD